LTASPFCATIFHVLLFPFPQEAVAKVRDETELYTPPGYTSTSTDLIAMERLTSTADSTKGSGPTPPKSQKAILASSIRRKRKEWVRQKRSDITLVWQLVCVCWFFCCCCYCYLPAISWSKTLVFYFLYLATCLRQL